MKLESIWHRHEVTGSASKKTRWTLCPENITNTFPPRAAQRQRSAAPACAARACMVYARCELCPSPTHDLILHASCLQPHVLHKKCLLLLDAVA
eukprot:5294612-Pleurochrysis_carterae.AAC.2